MIKNYCIKIISSVFIMLTIVLVSSSLFAKIGTEVVVYNDFEITINYDDSSILIKDTTLNKSQVLNMSDDISRFSNYTILYNDYNNSNNINWRNTFTFYFYDSYYWSNYDSSTSYFNSNDYIAGYVYYSLYKIPANTYEWFVSSASGSTSAFGSSTINLYDNEFLVSSSNTLSDGYSYPIATTQTLTNPFTGETIIGVNKSIIYEVNYSEDNKTAILSAEIKNSAEGDKLYYSTLGYSLTGKLMNPIELNQSQATAITLSRNTMIHLQALDSER